MSFGIETYLIKSLLDVLKRVDRPVSVDELSFRLRAPRNIINVYLVKLEEAKVVNSRNNHEYFLLNPDVSQQNMEMLVK